MGHFITTVIGTATGMVVGSGVIMAMAFNPRIIKWVTKRTIKLVEEIEIEEETDL